MTVGKAIYYLLTNSTDIAAIVSTRVFPEVAQQDAPLPYIVYNISNNEPSDTKAEPSEMDTANVEVNCFSTSYTESIDLGVAVRAALDRVTGTYNGVNVQSIAYMSETLNFDEAQRAYLVSSDYDVRIARSDFEIAQGSPITGVTLGELSDVEIAGVTNDQVLSYDSATNTWVPATDGGAISLDDLTDVIISAPESGEFFRYDGGEWVNDSAVKGDVGLGNVDNTSDANKPVSTAAQTALDLKADITSVPTDLDDLDDVQIIGTPTLGQALVYGAGKWLPGAAGATDLGDLDDVNTTGAAFGSLLTFNGSSWDISAGGLPTDDIYFHQRYETESEALRAGATATVELYFTCTAQGNGLAESASSDTPTAGYVINRKIYYSEAGFADPDTGTWVEFTPAPADDATFATVKAALLEHLKARTGGTVPISLKQTWEETAVAPAFTGLLNETYGSGAAAAYSTRRLNGNYTGACMTIRRASDSTTTTIGFSSEDIDEAAITTFCTGTTCTVLTWYDQSQTGGTGVGNDATAASTANEPTIYTGGALVKENGRVALDVNDNTLTTSSTITLAADLTMFYVTKKDNTSGGGSVLAWGNSLYAEGYAGQGLPVFSNTVGNQFIAKNSPLNNNFDLSFAASQKLIYTNRRGTTGATALNGSTEKTATATLTSSVTFDTITGNTSGGYHAYDGIVQEAIFYASDKSTDRTSIESNIGDYFTQNTPLLDTYTGAAACYSLRLMRTAYTGALIRVRRSSDNTELDINANVFGELDTVSLLDFAGTGDAFVKTWYDQSGNSNDATQTATGSQPQIVSSGAVITENGKPAVQFIRTSTTKLPFTTGLSSQTNIIAVAKNTDTTWGTLVGESFAGGLRCNNSALWDSSTNADDFYHNGSLFLDGVELSTGTSASNVQRLIFANAVSGGYADTLVDIGEGYTGRQWSGPVQEIILYASDQSATATREGIETNINTFYSIY